MTFFVNNKNNYKKKVDLILKINISHHSSSKKLESNVNVCREDIQKCHKSHENVE